MRTVFLALISLVLLSSSVFAEDLLPALTSEVPQAIIIGPEEVDVGECVWLKTEGSIGKTFNWIVLPPTAEQHFRALPIADVTKQDDGTESITVKHEGHFSSPNKGIYYFIFIATEGNISSRAVHILNNGKSPDPGPDPDPDPDPSPKLPDIDIPSNNFKTMVEPILTKIVGNDKKKDSYELTLFYWDLADVVERDEGKGIIKTTDDLRNLNIQAGTLMFQQTKMKGKYSGLAQTIDNALAQALGLEVVQLSTAKRKDAVAIVRAIAWACKEVHDNE